MSAKDTNPSATHYSFPYFFSDVDGINFTGPSIPVGQPSIHKWDLAIYYDSLASNDYIDCRCSRWDVQNYQVIIETWLKKADMANLIDNTTVGAVGELYTILGRPRYYDKTWSSKNTLRLLPVPSSTSMPRSNLHRMRKETLIFPKNISYGVIPGGSGWVTVKIEGLVSGSSNL